MRDFACLVLETASHPPFCAGFHTKPPIKAFKHFEVAGDTETIEGISVTCVYDPRCGQRGYIDADRIAEGG